jgi:trans-2,3-dihydro-3-hydroxyanthranilate isomerase
MNQEMRFFITDVFAEKRYSGNQLATFLDCASLSDSQMQQIAREINFSETTFILSEEQKKGGYDVRIFTPGAEVEFAGHPTLGTAYIIQRHVIQKPAKEVILNLKVGQVPVSFPVEGAKDRLLWMKQAEPRFGEILDTGRLAAVLSLRKDDIDSCWPIEQVSTGLPFIIVPLKTLDALKRVTISKEAHDKLIKETWAKIILVFCRGGYTELHDLAVRVFPVCFGIPEDPATGSGNGCLAAYLVKNRYFQSASVNIRTGQGYEIGRPSLLALQASEKNGRITVAVGGQVMPVAQGRWER